MGSPILLLTHLFTRVATLLIRSRRSVVVNAAPEHYPFLQTHLGSHGIPTHIRRGRLLAYRRRERLHADTFLIEFAEFIVNAPPTLQGEWLEFCLGLLPVSR